MKNKCNCETKCKNCKCDNDREWMAIDCRVISKNPLDVQKMKEFIENNLNIFGEGIEIFMATINKYPKNVRNQTADYQKQIHAGINRTKECGI